MAAKKTTNKPVVKTTEAAVKTTTPVTVDKKTEDKVVKTPVTVKKEATGAVEGKAVETKKPEAAKAPAKKAQTVKTTAKKTTKKAELQSTISVQFAGKSYSQEDLVKIAKDVWKYDLKQKARSLTSIELYVKPEESLVYYVMNHEFTGSFYI